jgi:hypothetical protein
VKTNFFEGLRTVEAIKTAYRKLAMQHHPDRGGDVAVMQALNEQYQRALKACDGQKSYSRTEDGENREHTYKYNEGMEAEIMETLAKLLKIKGLEVDLIGLWLWVGGETRANKDTLKELGCKWHAKRAVWYWRPESAWTGRYARNHDLMGLAAKYGVTHFKSDDKPANKPSKPSKPAKARKSLGR